MSLKIGLTEVQSSHMKTIDWLFSDSYPGSGRTHCLCVHMLRKLSMQENWNMPILVVDHDPRGTKDMIKRMESMLVRTNLIYEVNLTNNTIMITGRKFLVDEVRSEEIDI